MCLDIVRKTLALTVALGLMAALSTNAVDVYDGIRAPRGLYGISYSTYYTADDFNDADGDSAISDYGYTAMHETLRLTWYSPDVVFTVLAPFGHVEADYFDEDDDGLGDIIVAAGGFLPAESFDLQLLLAAKLPTGNYDEDKQINMGTGQLDLYPALYLHKSSDDFTFDAVAKYFVKMENEDTNVNPGDEFLFEMCGTRSMGGINIGPQMSWRMGNDSELDGEKLEDSGKQVFALGGEIFFKLFGLSTTINYVRDVYTKNTKQGQLICLKLCGKF